MRNIYNTFLLCVYWMNYGITGIQLLGCGSNGLAEFSEKSNFTLTCDGFDSKDSVSWQGENNDESSTFVAGTCPCCTCSNTLQDLPVSRTNATVSQLTVLSSRSYDNYRFTCFITGNPSQKSSCLIQAMYPADVTSCSVVINSGSWNISGSCTVSKVFTYSNIYKCTWYRGTSPTTLITTTKYTPVNHSDPNYRQGTCTFTTAFDLPLVAGSYYYKVVVDPGGTEKQFGPLEIERPIEPTIECTPSPNVQENTNINCDCKTTNIGKPGGYLTWSRESNGKVNIINNGSYSGTSLIMIPQLLNASDHNTTVLQCTVVWMNITIKGGFYIATLSTLRMDPCGLDSTLEIIEDRENNTVVCSGLKADNLTWVLETNNTIIVGDCPWPPENNVKDTCVNIIQPQVFFPRRTSANESILIINPTLIKNTFLRTFGKLSCQTNVYFKYECQLDLVYAAQGSCSVEFRRESRPWTVHGTCNITKAYSARGRYRCQWYQSLGMSSEKHIGTFVIMSTVSYPTGEMYVSGLCQMPPNIAMPMEEGNYNYKVNIIPGMVNIPANILPRSEIWRPSRPTVSCSPSFYVPENKNITCTCSTQSVGVPGGRLQWSLSRNNSFSIVNTGKYDVPNLEMLLQDLSLLDHDTIQIRCDVEWSEIILGEAHNLFVGDTPSQSEMKLNHKTGELSVIENGNVTFECQANGRPNPNISLINQDKNRELCRSTSPLFFNLSTVQCEDTGTYACVASNGMGEDKTNFSKLYVKCKPRGISGTIPPEQLSSMTFMGQPVQQTFTVIAYPSPNNFTVSFLGSRKNACDCEAVMKGVILNVIFIQTEKLYITNVTLKLFNVMSDAAFGFYRIRLSNEYGHDDFVFEIKESQSVCNQDEKDILARGIGIGVGVGVGVMLGVDVIIIIVVWTWRQQVISYCGEKENADSTYEMTTISNAFQNNIETPYSIPEDNSKTNDNPTVETTLHPSVIQDNEKLYSLPDDESSEVYTAMQRSDLGVMSSYARLDQIETITDTLREYQNTEQADIISHLETTTII